MFLLREQLPLKQGLRLFHCLPLDTYYISQRTTSTKTRIKTEGSFSELVGERSQRTTSTKTRIKTFITSSNFHKSFPAQRTTSTKTRIKTPSHE